jgi:hypothetical protein
VKAARAIKVPLAAMFSADRVHASAVRSLAGPSRFDPDSGVPGPPLAL